MDKNENIFFIEVNPRIQVEHTITEEITGIDIVRSQIQIARGHRLSDPQIHLKSQHEVLEGLPFSVELLLKIHKIISLLITELLLPEEWLMVMGYVSMLEVFTQDLRFLHF